MGKHFWDDFSDCKNLGELSEDLSRKFKEDGISADDLESLEKIMLDKKDKAKKEKIFYILFSYHHFKKNFTECRKLVEETEGLENRPIWNYFKSVVHSDSGRGYAVRSGVVDKGSEMGEAIEYADKWIKSEKNRGTNINFPGMYHNYCEIIYYALDEGYRVTKKQKRDAMKYIDIAIEINDSYGKYYYTKGRLCLALGRYEEAKNNFKIAIDLEDSSQKDYAIRIVDYQGAMWLCEMREKNSKMIKKAQKIQDEFDSEKKDIIGLLALFTGIISIIYASIEFMCCFKSLFDAVVLLVALLGVLLIAFSSMMLMVLQTKDKLATKILIMIIGIILLVVSFECIVKYKCSL